jgi:hypothetical protein
MLFLFFLSFFRKRENRNGKNDKLKNLLVKYGGKVYRLDNFYFLESDTFKIKIEDKKNGYAVSIKDSQPVFFNSEKELEKFLDSLFSYSKRSYACKDINEIFEELIQLKINADLHKVPNLFEKKLREYENIGNNILKECIGEEKR